ncbi:hypothetical protein pb186bvf_001014 [Paramecium bursaria]
MQNSHIDFSRQLVFINYHNYNSNLDCKAFQKDIKDVNLDENAKILTYLIGNQKELSTDQYERLFEPSTKEDNYLKALFMSITEGGTAIDINQMKKINQKHQLNLQEHELSKIIQFIGQNKKITYEQFKNAFLG